MKKWTVKYWDVPIMKFLNKRNLFLCTCFICKKKDCKSTFLDELSVYFHWCRINETGKLFNALDCTLLAWWVKLFFSIIARFSKKLDSKIPLLKTCSIIAVYRKVETTQKKRKKRHFFFQNVRLHVNYTLRKKCQRFLIYVYNFFGWSICKCA